MKVATLHFEELIAVFGDPRPFMREDGTVGAAWESKILAPAKIPGPGLPLAWDRERTVQRFQCHRLLVRHFEAALEECFLDAAAWATVNDFGGCYAFRLQRGSRKPSIHSWAAGIDLDVCDNPMGRKPKVHPTVVSAFRKNGFVWGGDFAAPRRDGMHFEFADLLALTAPSVPTGGG